MVFFGCPVSDLCQRVSLFYVELMKLLLGKRCREYELTATLVVTASCLSAFELTTQRMELCDNVPDKSGIHLWILLESGLMLKEIYR